MTDDYIHTTDMNYLKASDVVIAEVTVVSMGVGYEIGRAVEQKKPILALFRAPDGS
jgi:2'-deoxynucleoside 5'-phosphate N-hydrolase